MARGARSRAVYGLALFTWSSLYVCAAAADDFNPAGRRRRTPEPSTATRPAPSSPAQAARNKSAGKSRGASSAASPADEKQLAGASEALVARYLAILDQDPGAEFPLERLVQLYRQRDGNLDQLVRHYEPLAARSDAAGQRARLTLAGVYVHAGDGARAEALYAALLAADPEARVPAQRLAKLLAKRGDVRGARERLAPTLKLKQPSTQREEALRSLIGWSLDLSDLEGARSYHAELVREAQGSFFVRAELGRLLVERQLYAPAAEEYEKLVELARGDSRTLGPALRDLGKVLGKLGKYPEALAVLNQAERNTSQQSGLRREVLDALVEVHRAADRLPELVTRLEQEPGLDFDHQVLLGRLEEETGQVDRARKSYEAALAKNPDALDVRLKLIQILELSGELEQVIGHYQKLIRSAPQNPDFAFHLADAYLQRGQQADALRVLTQLEERSKLQEDTLARLVEFYEKVAENDRAMALLERLAKGNDPRHLVELGDRYFARGETDRALRIWQRLARDPNDAAALHTLGEVYLDHDLPERALETLAQAMKLQPDRVPFTKSYGLALERAGAGAANPSTRARYYREAEQLWEQLLERGVKENDSLLARDARQHIVTLWSLTGTLAERVPPLERRLSGTPPDLNAGRLLAETELRLRRFDAAEKTLRSVIERAPGDVESYLRLERALVQQGNVEAAIAVLAKLAELDPARAKEYLTRMASYSAESYQDDRAIAYAARAVELSPDDAEGHQRLGEMYRERQDVEHAILEFRQAISKNDRLFAVHFQLAELLINREQVEEADQLLRHVLRSSPDEQLISRAAHLSMQIHLGRGTLESLEKELLPIALGHANRPVYRRLLVEIYGALAFPLANQAKSQDPAAAAQARAALSRLGQRAVKPLLDALGDNRDTQQRIAIDLLSYIQNKSAGPSLLNFASGDAEPELRTRAMVAAGALADPALLGKFEQYLERDGASDGDPVSVAAVWALANLESPQAHPSLVRLLSERAPTLQALAVLGLARLGDRRDARLFESILESSEHAQITRAAAAFALAELGDGRALGAVQGLVDATDPVVRATATLSLARLGAPGAKRSAAEALISSDPELAEAGTRAACVLASDRYRPAPRAWPIPEGRVDARALLRELLPDPCSPDLEAEALELLAPEIAEAVTRTAQGSARDARSLSALLLDADGQPAFLPLTRQLAKAERKRAEGARQAAERIGQGVVGGFLQLLGHPSPELRQSALRFLGSRPEAPARQAVLTALGDSDIAVQRTALNALSARPDAAGALAVANLLDAGNHWSLRRQAAQALEQMGHAAAGEAVVAALGHSALEDRYALVRDAAARALFAIEPAAAGRVLDRLRQSDPESRVRATAQELLGRKE
jgi:tetratricopeptide (TPR) repeat protein/HEAT repeat protein